MRPKSSAYIEDIPEREKSMLPDTRTYHTSEVLMRLLYCPVKSSQVQSSPVKSSQVQSDSALNETEFSWLGLTDLILHASYEVTSPRHARLIIRDERGPWAYQQGTYHYVAFPPMVAELVISTQGFIHFRLVITSLVVILHLVHTYLPVWPLQTRAARRFWAENGIFKGEYRFFAAIWMTCTAYYRARIMEKYQWKFCTREGDAFREAQWRLTLPLLVSADHEQLAHTLK